MDRKDFIKQAGYLLAGIGTGLARPAFSPAQLQADSPALTILHTNDTHSRIKPFPQTADEQLAGLGGYARRATLIKQIRSRQNNVLLLDGGDMFQGTPYFNFYNGALELELMSAMKYDAAALGNHEFDNGVEGLARQMPKANFPFLCANYHTRNSPIDPFVEPYIIKQYGPVRVGIFGLGIAFENLVLESLHKGVRYRDARVYAGAMVRTLKKYKQCDYIICLSHLGYKYTDNRISDYALAKTVDGIDLIIGGHTHTFLEEPVVITKPEGRPTYISQVGWGGVILGRLDITFNVHKEPTQVATYHQRVSSLNSDKS